MNMEVWEIHLLTGVALYIYIAVKPACAISIGDVRNAEFSKKSFGYSRCSCTGARIANS